jgi:hemoglobin-like flavoprotein
VKNEDIQLVKESWAQVSHAADEVARSFYAKIFQLDADVARKFAGTDMTAQHANLAKALDTVVSGLGDPDALRGPLQELGARHVAHGVSERDFAPVGEALLATLREGFCDQWNDSLEKAWLAAWALVSVQMLVGFRRKAAA